MTNRFLGTISGLKIIACSAAILLVSCHSALATDVEGILRIGTGGSAGTYFPIGSIIADAISESDQNLAHNPSATTDLRAIAQRSNGSVANISDIDAHLLEAGFAQADVAYWAYQGIGPFEGDEPVTSIKVIGTLYLENVHLVVRTDAKINSIGDLKGRRVSVDEVGSGTLLDVIPILKALDIDINELNTAYLKTADAIDRMRDKNLDAFFVIAGYPVAAVSELVTEGIAKVLPIHGESIQSLSNEYPFFTLDNIPANTYNNTHSIPTLSVAALLIVHENLDEKTVYQITRILWSERTSRMLTDGHPRGADINIDTALVGVELPLHSGAEKFYTEQGMLETKLDH